MTKKIDETLVKKTFLIPQTLDKALKFKAVNEEKKLSEVLAEALTLYLYDYIEKIKEENEMKNIKNNSSSTLKTGEEILDIHKKISLLKTAEKIAEKIREELISVGVELSKDEEDDEYITKSEFDNNSTSFKLVPKLTEGYKYGIGIIEEDEEDESEEQ